MRLLWASVVLFGCFLVSATLPWSMVLSSLCLTEKLIVSKSGWKVLLAPRLLLILLPLRLLIQSMGTFLARARVSPVSLLLLVNGKLWARGSRSSTPIGGRRVIALLKAGSLLRMPLWMLLIPLLPRLMFPRLLLLL